MTITAYFSHPRLTSWGGGVKRVCAIEIIKEQAAISNLKEEGDQYRLEAGGWLDDNLFSQV